MHSVNQEPLFRKVDCLQIPVPNLEAGLNFYCDHLGHELLWRTPTAAGLRMLDTDTELVLQTERTELEVNLLVASTDLATAVITQAGGMVIEPPFDIQIGRCAVVQDLWGNQLVLVDLSKGLLATDEQGNVVGTMPPLTTEQ
jgi:predicted enzyme related to lactoylglutathione lyase